MEFQHYGSATEFDTEQHIQFAVHLLEIQTQFANFAPWQGRVDVECRPTE
jgi:hypothetical protein